MARGWANKSVEAQIDMAETHPRAGSEPMPDPSELQQRRKMETMLLSRTRVVRELESARNPRYKALLEKTLAGLDAQLSMFKI